MDILKNNCISKEMLRHLSTGQEQLLITVTDGPHLGEQLLYVDNSIRYYRPERHDRFLQRVLPQILAEQEETFCNIEDEIILIERIGRNPSLVICGGGYVAMEVLKAAKSLNFYVTVIEDRVLFANQARHANADQVICNNFDQALKQIPGGKDTYFVIVTRGHRYDKACLREIFQKSYAYVGMMGSRGRTALLKKELLEEGISQEQIDTLKAPIGLDIGAETPAEIAVSIVAELIQKKKQCRKTTVFDNEVLNALISKTSDAVLCTIVKKRGSAPRTVGTRMLVYADHTVAGTIGGGCVEAEVVSQAAGMLQGREHVKRITVSMSIETAEDQGLVCGGTIDILMQKI